MMLKQTIAVAAINLRNIPHRFSTSLVIVIGIAGVVAVLISFLAMSTGLIDSMVSSGRADRAIVLRNGSSSESTSILEAVQARRIADAPGVKRGPDGGAILSQDVVTLARSVKRDGSEVSLPVRGVSTGSFALRPEIKVISGRLFEPGVFEVIVGKSARIQYGGLDVGSKLAFRNTQWTVVGVFESNGGTLESELMTQNDTLLSVMHRTQYSSVTVRLDSVDGAFETFRSALMTDPTLTVDVYNEKEFLELQSRSLSRLLSIIAYVVGGIMAIGAILAAVNTMYSAVSSRSTEIAMLRAVGFRSTPIVTSVLLESMLLALLGGVIGAVIAWSVFNGYTVSATTGMGGGMGSGTPESRVFSLTVSPGLAVVGLVWAWVVGLLGGLFPAIRAARLPIATALREQ